MAPSQPILFHLRLRSQRASDSPTPGQYGQTDLEPHDVKEPNDDYRNPETSEALACLGRALEHALDTIDGKPLRRRPFTYMGPERSSNLAASVALDTAAISAGRSDILQTSAERTSFNRLKQVRIQRMSNWPDGKARLWNPPFDFLPLVVRKIVTERTKGVLLAPYWPAQAWFERLCRLTVTIRILEDGSTELHGLLVNPE